LVEPPLTEKEIGAKKKDVKRLRDRLGLQAAGKPVRVVVAPGYNHFEVNETLASPYGFFGRAVLEQMKLKPA
jgi:hypothetical protein